MDGFRYWLCCNCLVLNRLSVFQPEDRCYACANLRVEVSLSRPENYQPLPASGAAKSIPSDHSSQTPTTNPKLAVSSKPRKKQPPPPPPPPQAKIQAVASPLKKSRHGEEHNKPRRLRQRCDSSKSTTSSSDSSRSGSSDDIIGRISGDIPVTRCVGISGENNNNKREGNTLTALFKRKQAVETLSNSRPVVLSLLSESEDEDDNDKNNNNDNESDDGERGRMLAMPSHADVLSKEKKLLGNASLSSSSSATSTAVDADLPELCAKDECAGEDGLATDHGMRWPANLVRMAKPQHLWTSELFGLWLGFVANKKFGGWSRLEDCSVQRGNSGLTADHVGIETLREELGVYATGRQATAMYGRANHKLVDVVLRRTKFDHGQVFTDIGSGVGQVILQVAALRCCKLALGIELLKGRHLVALKLDDYFAQFCEDTGLSHGKYMFHHGDFRAEDCERDIIASDVLFCNNAKDTFGARSVNGGHTLNWAVAYLAIQLKEGSHIICFDDIPELDQMVALGAFSKSSEMCAAGAVSWTCHAVKLFHYKLEHATWMCRKCQAVHETVKCVDKKRHNIVTDCPACGAKCSRGRHVGKKAVVYREV